MCHMWKKDREGFVSNLNRIGLFAYKNSEMRTNEMEK